MEPSTEHTLVVALFAAFASVILTWLATVPGRISRSEVAELVKSQNAKLEEIDKDVDRRIENNAKAIDALRTMITEITKEIQVDLKLINASISDRSNHAARIEERIFNIANDIAEIRQRCMGLKVTGPQGNGCGPI